MRRACRDERAYAAEGRERSGFSHPYTIINSAHLASRACQAQGSATGLSIPIYWFGFAVLALFAPQSGYLLQIPFLSWYGGYVSPGDDPFRWLQSLWGPWVVLAIPLAAICHRMARASLLEVMNAGHVRTARAKGLREAVVMRRHALRAALPPVLGLVSASVALMVANVVLVQALILEAAALISVTMLIADLLHARLDPQVRRLS
jgi:ABC-type dipeptide/oligopeptide/nickel transport system permease component